MHAVRERVNSDKCSAQESRGEPRSCSGQQQQQHLTPAAQSIPLRTEHSSSRLEYTSFCSVYCNYYTRVRLLNISECEYRIGSGAQSIASDRFAPIFTFAFKATSEQ